MTPRSPPRVTVDNYDYAEVGDRVLVDGSRRAEQGVGNDYFTYMYSGGMTRSPRHHGWQHPGQRLSSLSLRVDEGTATCEHSLPQGIAVKTRSSVRPVKLTPRLEAVVDRKARMAARWSADEDFVFSASKGRAKSYRNVRRALKRIAELAELPVAVNAHDFRHALVMNMRPYPDRDAKKLMFAQSLGHKDTTMIDQDHTDSTRASLRSELTRSETYSQRRESASESLRENLRVSHPRGPSSALRLSRSAIAQTRMNAQSWGVGAGEG